MSFCINLRKQDELVSEDGKVNVNKLQPNEMKIVQDYSRFSELSVKIQSSLKTFKYENETGSFQVSVYIGKYYSVYYTGYLISKDYILLGDLDIMIYRNGNVCFWGEGYSECWGYRKKKISSGFMIDKDKVDELCDYIETIKEQAKLIRKQLREKNK